MTLMGHGDFGRCTGPTWKHIISESPETVGAKLFREYCLNGMSLRSLIRELVSDQYPAISAKKA
jgi:hypothetical protein